MHIIAVATGSYFNDCSFCKKNVVHDLAGYEYCVCVCCGVFCLRLKQQNLTRKRAAPHSLMGTLRIELCVWTTFAK